MKKEALKQGQHFWAILDDRLCVIIKDLDGKFYVCGGWECAVSDFKIIQLIDFPDGYNEDDLYYLK